MMFSCYTVQLPGLLHEKAVSRSHSLMKRVPRFIATRTLPHSIKKCSFDKLPIFCPERNSLEWCRDSNNGSGELREFANFFNTKIPKTGISFLSRWNFYFYLIANQSTNCLMSISEVSHFAKACRLPISTNVPNK